MRGDDPDEVQGIGGGQNDQFLSRALVAQLPQLSDGVSQGKLFSPHAGDEPPAANLPPRLKPSQHLQQFKPARGTRFAFQEITTAENPATGCGNVIWALLNTREFIFIQ